MAMACWGMTLGYGLACHGSLSMACHGRAKGHFPWQPGILYLHRILAFHATKVGRIVSWTGPILLRLVRPAAVLASSVH